MSSIAPQPSVTFEQAQAMPKSMSDEFIVKVMNDKLEVIPGTSAGYLKNYLTDVPPDRTDEAFLRSPDKVVAFRDELSDFVSSHLKVWVSDSLSPQEVHSIKQRAGDFKKQIAQGKEVVGQWFRDYMGGTRHRYPRHEMEFHGFNLTTTDGPKDLLHSNVKVAGIRPNIHVQGGLTSNFIQWRSSAYVEAAGRGEKPDLVKRIYLNPTMESSVKIFTEIVDAADKAGLQVKGKILDRSTSAVSSFTFKKDGSIGSLRGDGIVIGTSAKDANSLLGIVEEIYNKHRAAFAGRKVPRVPKQIGQGVAIGEDISDTESLTSHRAAVIGNAALLAKEKLGLQQWEKVSPVQEAKAIQTFRKLWSQVAAANGIDPQNIAFNRR